MILFRSSAGEGCIELHTDGDVYWFMERWRLEDRQMSRGNKVWDDPYEVIRMTMWKKWATWHSRPWLAPMLKFMMGYFGEDLFTLVALENM